ncbi:RNA polymerase II subunit A C-terminal domain phosphatase [Coemansia sp. RSA 678]|nr:RNA polymerase II subunit A C-terminal domain phosphatase [Coemansia sp. RSA 678]
MNRSMEAHYQLKKHGYNIESFGTGSAVRLPGPTLTQPNIYNFGTAYNQIYTELTGQDRNCKVKQAPQCFHDESAFFDVIFTCEEHVFDAVCEELLNRAGVNSWPVHVINIDIEDNHRDAVVGAKTILELAWQIVASRDLESDMDRIIEDVQNKMLHPLLYTVAFY